MNPQTPTTPTAGAPEPAPVAAAPVVPTPPQTEAPPTGPAYVGNSNIVDRSVQGLYPTPVAPAPPTPFQPASLPEDSSYTDASSAFRELIVLICGIASATAYLLIFYIVKNLWATAIVSVSLAILAVIISILDYRQNNKHVSPFSVIGLSAATFTIVYVANIVIAEMVIHSAYDSMSY